MGRWSFRLRAVILGLGTLLACRADNFEPAPEIPIERPRFSVVTTTDTLLPDADAYLRGGSSVANQNRGFVDSLRVFFTPGFTTIERGLIHFDQAAIAAQVGSGTLVSATLVFAIKSANSQTGGNNVSVHRVLKSWPENAVTWNCRIDSDTTNLSPNCVPANGWQMNYPTPDAFNTTATSVTHFNPGQTGIAQFDVTADVQAFLAGTSNYGWLLKLANESAMGRVSFRTREATAKPRLVLVVDRYSIPTQVPDTIPAWVWSPTNIDSNATLFGTAKFFKNIVGVSFKPTATLPQRQAAIDSVNGTVVGGFASAGEGTYIVQVPDTTHGGGLVAAQAILARQSQVAWAMYDVQVQSAYRKPKDGTDWETSDWDLGRNSLTGLNWGLEAIEAPMAWGCSIGNDSTRVAMVDGFAATVPTDLAGNVVAHYDTIRSPFDPQHGIETASVLGAIGNNNQDMTGVMWNAEIHMYELGSPATILLTVQRIKEAGEAGIKVINVSIILPLGVAESTLAKAGAALTGVLGQLRAGAPSRRPLVVLAAGNANGDAAIAGFPRVAGGSDSSQVLVVAAMNAQGTLWSASNYGSLVDIAAPGEDVGVLDSLGNVVPQEGTSVAAPFVSGIAGLLLAFDSRLDGPDLRDLILAAADSGNWSVSGSHGGMPIANAYWALKLAARRSGAPICGNRLWMDGNAITVQRTAATDEILHEVATSYTPLEFDAVYHGGHRIDFATLTESRMLTFAQGQWSASTATTPDATANGAWWSRGGSAHDQEESAFIRQLVWDNDEGTGSPLTGVYLVDPVTSQEQQLTTIPGFNHNFSSFEAVTYPPQGSHLLVPVRPGNSSTVQVYAVNKANGQKALLWTVAPAFNIHLAINEEGTEAMMQYRGVQPGDGCTLEFRTLPTGTLARTMHLDPAFPGGPCGTQGSSNLRGSLKAPVKIRRGN